MKQPSEIKKILITAPHQAIYFEQLIDIIYYLNKKFPQAEFTYSTHTLPDRAYDFSKIKSQKINITTIDTSQDSSKLDFYKDFDLHVGYRLHGHIKCLSIGIPSILIAEDSRGLGQKFTLNNLGVFTAFDDDFICKSKSKKQKSLKYENIFERIFSIKTNPFYLVVTVLGIKFTRRIIRDDLVKKSTTLITEIDNSINQSLCTEWISYTMIPVTINNIYQNLFLPSLRNSINNACNNKAQIN